MKKIKKNKTILLVVSFTILTLLFTGCTDNSSNKPINDGINNDTNNNETIYPDDFEFRLLDGTLKNISDYRGKYVLIDFFGVYCQPCQYQMLALTQIYERYKNTDLEIISIDAWIASGETTNLVYQYISSAREQGVYLNWTFGVDDSKGTLLHKYASGGVPTLYLRDKNGNIYYTKTGYTEYSVLSDKIDELFE